jgi:hypothetical protein
MPQKTKQEAQELKDALRAKLDSELDLQARIMSFSKIKVSAIDPEIRTKIEHSVKNIRRNLELLKSISQ